MGLPSWAAINAGNLARGLALPDAVRRVTIAADHDASGVGEKAAHEAAGRWVAEGRVVKIAVPHQENSDFNDLHAEKMA